MMPNAPTTRSISYFDQTKGCRVQKDVTVPQRAKVRDLNGMTVEEINSMDDLKFKWKNDILGDVSTPLTSHSRLILRKELTKLLTDPAEIAAIGTLCDTWHCDDDRVLKLVGRLLNETGRQKSEEASTVNVAHLTHENALLREKDHHQKREITALTADINKLVQERDALQRANSGGLTSGLAAVKQADQLRKQAEQERDILKRDAQRNIEIALNEYEQTVMGKLGDVASDHKFATAENVALKGEIRRLNNQMAMKRDDTVPKEVKKMSGEQEKTAQTEVGLKSGDQVFCKVSGEGPYVLVTKIDEAQVEYANPVSGRKNSFNVGKLPIYDAWLVRCKDTTFRTMPEATMTRAAPKSSFSLSGIRGLVTSDVTAKIAQAAIWASMITLLYMQRAG